MWENTLSVTYVVVHFIGTEARVARANPPDLTRWAELGARARLEDIERERQDIFRAFPALRKEGAPAKPARADASEPPQKARRRSGMSDEQRKAVSERMKRYWAQRAKDKQAAQGNGTPESESASAEEGAPRKRGRKKTAGRRGSRKSARRGASA
jgi:hypothetical protein